MHMEVQTQIASVYSRTTSKGVVYDINLGDGSTKQTWKAEIADALNRFAGSGQVLQLRYDVKPSNNPQYPPRETITAFAPPGQMLAPEVAVGGNAGFAGQPYAQQPQGGMQQGVMQQPQQQPQQIQPAPPKGFDDPRVVIRVTKMGCIEHASNVVSRLLQGAGPEAATQTTDLILAMAERFYAAARSHENPVPTATQYQTNPQGQVTASQPLSGAQIASDIPGVSLGAPQQTEVAEGGIFSGSEWD